MRVGDELGELFSITEFAEAFEVRGRPGWSPGQLALVTVLQFAKNLTDRAAAHRVRYGMDLKYALGLELDDPGFDPSVLSEFRTRLVEHGMEEKVLDLLLTALKDRGLALLSLLGTLPSFHLCRALPGSEYYDGSAPLAPSAGIAPIPSVRPGWPDRGERTRAVPTFTVVRLTG